MQHCKLEKYIVFGETKLYFYKNAKDANYLNSRNPIICSKEELTELNRRDYNIYSDWQKLHDVVSIYKNLNKIKEI